MIIIGAIFFGIFSAAFIAAPIALVSSTIMTLGATAKSGSLNFSRSSGRFIQHFYAIGVVVFLITFFGSLIGQAL